MNGIVIKLKMNEVCIELSQESEYKDIINELNEKISSLQTFYQNEKTPITITGRQLTNTEFENIKNLIIEKIDTDIKYEKPDSMGLHNIKNIYENTNELTQAKFIKGSLRSGQRLEHVGSLVILGDVNSGAEVIASENIVVVGNLRGIAHAGAKGNKKSFISAYSIESPQLRIANIVTSFEKTENEPIKKARIAYINNEDTIIIE